MLYPKLDPPYNAAVNDILGGITAEAGGRVWLREVTEQSSAEAIAQVVSLQGVRTVVALARYGVLASERIQSNIPVITGLVLVGATRNEPCAGPIFTFTPDPDLLFSRLQRLTPTVRRIFVIYNPAQNNWLIRLAQEAAKQRNLEVVPYAAANIPAALGIYRDVVGRMDPKTDALWLAQDTSTVDDDTVLPLILAESWRRSLVVFSSGGGHSSRGALFSAYPQGEQYGRVLGRAAIGSPSGGNADRCAIYPLRQFSITVNPRTASHLGVQIVD